jgi:ferrous iron transport protein B
MGLTNASVGRGAVDASPLKPRRTSGGRVVALAGNPNVGKSTVFNALTGMHQHTGNWPGKTVTNAQGECVRAGRTYTLIDLPGTYSLMANSAEEEVARSFICFGEPDVTVVVCDATCLERNLNLVLQTLEVSKRTVVCVNLLDEAKRKHLSLDLARLSRLLGVRVVGCTARRKKSLHALMDAVAHACAEPPLCTPPVKYPREIEAAIDRVEPHLTAHLGEKLHARWVALKLLEGDPSLLGELNDFLGERLEEDVSLSIALQEARGALAASGMEREGYRDAVVASVIGRAEEIAREVVTYPPEEDAHSRDRRIDRILTGRYTAYPVMLLLLAFIFWLTIVGANYPSAWLSRALFALQDRLTALFTLLGAPSWLHGMLVLGMYRVTAWVISVMLPPMAIFFPLFTLLEDAGYLPRIAYNLDRPFQCCHACGKQALTMCMGFGCNAAGVVGCRIIDSPRERLLAMLTNSFVPCNGRFPTILTILTIFFVGTATGLLASLRSAMLLTLVIVLGVALTFLITRLLSATILRGVPSSFTLELPPYRRPQLLQVLVRSVFDRTLFVLGRAVAVAAPAGLLIWILANVTVGGGTLLSHCAAFLDPLGRLMGLDGVLLMAFLLALPANEIALPIAMMAYLAQGTLSDLGSTGAIREILLQNGWTQVTAVCMVLFTLLHSPCSTTLMTIKREAGGWRWVALACLLPTLCGVILCMAVNGVARLTAG